ncbi:unnamed protein product [Hymenolepis diminuta]|uniref:Uncharacterized protein n=1 Tax=Hymenolepis diminuta TaxID=6216 RepID=A0A564YMT8_HYMDI|nr:unnamed protein product [Hymenolepis diminuta]
MSPNTFANFLQLPAFPAECSIPNRLPFPSPQPDNSNQGMPVVLNHNPVVHNRPIHPPANPQTPSPIMVNHEQSQPLDLSSVAPAIVARPSNYVRHSPYPPTHTEPSVNDPPQFSIYIPYIEPHFYPFSSCPFNNFRYGTGIFPGVPPPIEYDPEYENELVVVYPPPPPAHTTPHHPPQIVFPHSPWFPFWAYFNNLPPR